MTGRPVNPEPDGILSFHIFQELGECYLETAEFAKAEAHFRAARRLWPQHPAPLLGLGEAALRQGNQARARRFFSQAVKLAPDNDQAWTGLGLAAENREERLALLNRALDLNPRNRRVLLELARLAESQTELAAGETALRRYLSWVPGDLELWLALGRCLKRLGHRQQAREAVERVLLFLPEHAEARELLQTLLSETP